MTNLVTHLLPALHYCDIFILTKGAPFVLLTGFVKILVIQNVQDLKTRQYVCMLGTVMVSSSASAEP